MKDSFFQIQFPEKCSACACMLTTFSGHVKLNGQYSGHFCQAILKEHFRMWKMNACAHIKSNV